MTEDLILRLGDGRSMGTAIDGNANGFPVFFCHGFTGSRLQRHPDADLARRFGIRLIALDRPGIGLSDPMPGRRVLDWATDVDQVADQLGVSRYAVIGWSAGGPHALACAFQSPQRVAGVHLVAPHHGWLIGPGASRRGSLEARFLAVVARFAPPVLGWTLRRLQSEVAERPEKAWQEALAGAPPVDRDTLLQFERMFKATLREAFRQGIEGVREDVIAVASPWGFNPPEVRRGVTVWYGAADRTVPPDAVRELINRLPNTQVRRFEEEGHFLLFRHWEELLKLVALQSGGPPN